MHRQQAVHDPLRSHFLPVVPPQESGGRWPMPSLSDRSNRGRHSHGTARLPAEPQKAEGPMPVWRGRMPGRHRAGRHEGSREELRVPGSEMSLQRMQATSGAGERRRGPVDQETLLWHGVLDKRRDRVGPAADLQTRLLADVGKGDTARQN